MCLLLNKSTHPRTDYYSCVMTMTSHLQKINNNKWTWPCRRHLANLFQAYKFLCQCIFPLGLLGFHVSTSSAALPIAADICLMFSLLSWSVGVRKPLLEFLSGWLSKSIHINRSQRSPTHLCYCIPMSKWSAIHILAATRNGFTSISIKYSQIFV